MSYFFIHKAQYLLNINIYKKKNKQFSDIQKKENKK